MSLDQESWEIPAAETCYFLAVQHTPGGGRAGSALLPSPLQESPSHPPPHQAGQRKEAAGKGLVPAVGR